MKVPSVEGQSQSNATSALQSSGLGVGSVRTEYSDTVAEGNVIRQGTGAGTYVDAGSSVDLVVSLGKKQVYYSFSKSVTNNKTDMDMTVVLEDTAGNQLGSTWTVPAGRTLTINANNLSVSTGTLRYKYTDGSTSSEAVIFTKQ